MMWVRFPNGQCVQYNNANYAVRNSEYTDLYKKSVDGKGQGWIAQVPNTCIVEVEFACRVWNPLTEPREDVAKELRSIKRKLVKASK
jgi:hypothetical protein